MMVMLEQVGRDQEPVLQNLFQLYTHDFSENWADTPRGDLQQDGRFPPYGMAEYWSVSTCMASLIYCDSALAGFVLVNNRGHTDTTPDHNMAEFFIVRKYRSCGVGRAAAEKVFASRPGNWEVAVARKNVPALSFWRRVIGSLPNVVDLRETDLNNEVLNGPIVRFTLSGT